MALNPALPETVSDLRRRRRNRFIKDNLRAYLFVLPWLVALIGLTAYPTIASFYYAMTRYTIVKPPEWIGFDNYVRMFTNDPLFWSAVGNTVIYAVVSVPVSLSVALLLATLLNLNTRGIGLYRTLFYLPALVPGVAIGLIWLLLLNPRGGLVNAGLGLLGLEQPGWLSSSTWAKPGLILTAIWAGSGASMLIFLAGLKDIPRSLVEAATIDGANSWQRYWHVVVPLLSPTIFFNLVTNVIGSFQVFAQVLAVSGNTGTIGPSNSLLMYVIHLYRNAFSYFSMGYASAMAIVLFLALAALTLLVVRSSSVWVHYEGGAPK